MNGPAAGWIALGIWAGTGLLVVLGVWWNEHQRRRRR
jgi:hypothetical protein